MNVIRALALSLAVVAGSITTAHAQSAKDKADPGKIAVFKINGSVTETPTDDFSLFGPMNTVSLNDLVARVKKAGDDKAVKAIVLSYDGGSLGNGQLEELRKALDEVRSKGKEIHSHADELSTGSYALLSGATRLSVVPTADIWLVGMYGEAFYVRGLLDLLEIKPDYLTCGDYKSAAEMFMRTGPSPEAEKMQNWLFDGIFETVVNLIASGRKIPAEKVRAWIDDGPYTAESAKKAGIIDAVEHRHEFIAGLKAKYGEKVKFDSKYGAKKGPEVDLSSPLGVFKLWGEILAGPKATTSNKDGVAIVYVDGPIMLGREEVSPLGAVGGAFSSALRTALDEAANDKTVKAVVLRIDSPGGSAVASEIILAATRRVKEKKPLVVSMGNVAGSGGYYVTCAADTIFADSSTITGSIGVVGGKFATTDLWKRVGVHWKAYQRGKSATLLSSADVFSKDERVKIQAWMDEIYGTFKGHVVNNRGKKLTKPIDEIAGGRVYTGKQALELGLVDKIGTLSDAIAFAANEAKLPEGYDVRVIPRPKNFLEILLEGQSGSDSEKSISDDVKLVGPDVSSAIWAAAAPLLKDIDPKRADAVQRALRRLSMIQKDGAVLMAPEYLFSH